jgi:H+/Cl- antiporter ClcA
MLFFYYGFGMALSCAFGIAIGNAWMRENRGGRWSRKAIWTIACTCALLGLAFGWALQTFLNFAWASPYH